MTTTARDALAAALEIEYAHTVEDAIGPGFIGWPDDADRILAHPFTEPERRALAAHFLDADALAAALRSLNFNGYGSQTNAPDAFLAAASAAILAALRGDTDA